MQEEEEEAAVEVPEGFAARWGPWECRRVVEGAAEGRSNLRSGPLLQQREAGKRRAEVEVGEEA